MGSVVTTAALRVAASVAISLVAQRFLPSQAPGEKVKPPEIGPSEIVQAVGPRRHGVGTFLPPAHLIFAEAIWCDPYAVGSDDEMVLHKVLALTNDAITGIGSFVIGGKRVSVDAEGWVQTAPFIRDGTSLVRLRLLSESAEHPDLVARFSADDVWTPDHKLTGVSTILAESIAPSEEDFQAIFPNREYTEFLAICEGPKVYDPRLPGDVFTANASLQIAHFLRQPHSYNAGFADIHWPSFAAFADHCDLIVPSQEGDIPNLRLGGRYDETEDPVEVLRRMERSCGARVFINGAGQWAICADEPGPVAVTLTEADILSIDVDYEPEIVNRTTIASGQYYSAELGYQATEFPELRNAAAVARYGERRLSLDLGLCPSAGQAQRLAKPALARANPERFVAMECQLAAIKALLPRAADATDVRAPVVRVHHQRLGMDRDFELVEGGVTVKGTGRPVVSLVLRSIDRNAWVMPLVEQKPAPTAIDDLGISGSAYQAFRLQAVTWTGDQVEIDPGLYGEEVIVEGASRPDDPAFDPANPPLTGWTALTNDGPPGQFLRATLPGLHIVRARFRQSGLGPWTYYRADSAAQTLTEIS